MLSGSCPNCGFKLTPSSGGPVCQDCGWPLTVPKKEKTMDKEKAPMNDIPANRKMVEEIKLAIEEHLRLVSEIAASLSFDKGKPLDSEEKKILREVMAMHWLRERNCILRDAFIDGAFSRMEDEFHHIAMMLKVLA